MNTFKYTILLLFVLSLMACKKQETMYYQGEERISFVLGRYESDSLSYSFAFDPTPKQKDTIYLKMRIQGAAQNRDREVKLRTGEGSTAILNEDFIIPAFSVPAGAITINYPLILINSEKMKTKSVRIVLEVDESIDFLPGGVGQEVGETFAVNAYKLWVSNKPDKPAYWDDVAYYFGDFSATKLRFMISVLGISDFSYESIGAYGLYNYPVALRNALMKHEAINGPLVDEFGDPVTF